jgi:hypothetical protein
MGDSRQGIGQGCGRVRWDSERLEEGSDGRVGMEGFGVGYLLVIEEHPDSEGVR